MRSLGSACGMLLDMELHSRDDGDAGKGRLLVGQQGPALREALWGLVREAKRGDPLTPVTVVGPSSYANLSLRQELGSGRLRQREVHRAAGAR